MLIMFGLFLILDGIASLIKFHKQGIFPQGVRVGRTLIGLILLKSEKGG